MVFPPLRSQSAAELQTINRIPLLAFLNLTQKTPKSLRLSFSEGRRGPDR
jgi:hypothetical protein